MSLPALSQNLLVGANPSVVLSSLAQPIEHLLIELLQCAHDGQMRIVPSGGLTKASMVQLARLDDPKERLQGIIREEQWPSLHWLRVLAVDRGLLRVDADATLYPTRVALQWLQLEPAVRIQQLLAGWLESDWDELTGLEGMRILPRPVHAIYTAKQSIQRMLALVPDNTWIEIDSFIAQAQHMMPSFFRQVGQEGRWSIRDKRQHLLDGDEHWGAVEGVWLRLVTSVTMRWLGLVEVGANDMLQPVVFRLTTLGSALLKNGDLPEVQPVEPLVLQPNFEVFVPRSASPYARFQLRRIADQARAAADPVYRLTRKSIHRALARGIGVDEMIAFLGQQTDRALPQNVLTALRDWAGEYGSVSLRRTVLLEAETQAMFEQLRHDRRLRLPAAKQVGELALSFDEVDAGLLADRIRAAGYGLASQLEEASATFSEDELALLMVAVEFYREACSALDIESEIRAGLRRRLVQLVPERKKLRAQQATMQAMSVLRKRLTDA